MAVHPWTRNWWRTLPDAYRAADGVQDTPPQLVQVGLNAQPTFLHGLDGWHLTPLEQTDDFMVLRFRRSFFGTDLDRVLNFQVWWTADTADGYLTVELTDATGRDLGTHALTGVAAGDGDDTLTGVLSTAEPITATLTIGTPVGDGGLLFTVRAVNVGYDIVELDDLTVPEGSGQFPLLRYMEGAGRTAGQVRDVSDGLWSGEFLKPANAPDTTLRWMAQMMGVSATIRNQSPDGLRAYLVNLTVNGRPASGTRRDINAAAKLYLTGTKQTVMVPSTITLHTLIMLVREDEVPGADTDLPAALAALVAFVRATGVVPAGHNLIARTATPTWDEWEAAAGVSWTDVEGHTRTWTDSDSLGVTITE